MSILKRKKGFTLIELMVSVALMLILVGAVVMIFVNSSDVFTSSEAKISIYQNARVALDIISRDLGGLDNSGTVKLRITNPTDTTSPCDILRFVTRTSTGTATIVYSLVLADNATRWNLTRSEDDGATRHLLARFVRAVSGNAPTFKIGFFYYDGDDGSGKTTYTDDDDATTGWIYREPPYTTATPNVSNPHTFDETATEVIKQIPPAIRITMDMTDEQSRVTRTISRTVWLTAASR